MWTSEEFVKIIYKKLRNGDPVECPSNDGGFMQPVGDYKTTFCFICDVCNEKLNIEPVNN